MLTAARLRELLHYEPKTGVWTVIKAYGRRRVGEKVDHILGKYRGITIDGKQYLSHRAAWLYMKGQWPTITVDHKNRKKNDNRWSNLRSASYQQQMCNSKLRSGTKSLHKGIFKLKEVYKVYFDWDYQRTYLGTYKTLKEAMKVRTAYEIKFHKEFRNAA